MKEYILNKKDLCEGLPNWLNNKHDFTDVFNIFDYFDMSNEKNVYLIIKSLPSKNLSVELYEYYFSLNPTNPTNIRTIFYLAKNTIGNIKINKNLVEHYKKCIVCENFLDFLDLITHINVFKTKENVELLHKLHDEQYKIYGTDFKQLINIVLSSNNLQYFEGGQWYRL